MRTDRLNSLLREVISEVIRDEVKHPNVHKLTSVTQVDITKDLSLAKVYVSIIGTDEERKNTVDALNKSAAFIAITASKRVVLRKFPSLTFKLDESAEKQAKIETILQKIEDERHPPSQ